MPVTPISIEEAAARKNLQLLIRLRWIAVIGQIIAIAAAKLIYDLRLPLPEMGAVILFLVMLNIVSFYRVSGPSTIYTTELLPELLLDVLALTIQLYLSGGAMNPFVSLFTLQVILGAILLRQWQTWIIVIIATICYAFLIVAHRDIDPLSLLAPERSSGLRNLHIVGSFVSFELAALLSVIFITRIMANLRDRDARLSHLRQQSAEEEHIVRIGLLASGAAHELGTPLATLSVILNDWDHMEDFHDDPDLAAEMQDMRLALDRCKEVISRILVSSGEARGEGAERTALVAFFDQLVAEWRDTRRPGELRYLNRFDANVTIVSDALIKQTLFNVFDNALEASPVWMSIEVEPQKESLVVTVRDRGPGFPATILDQFGKPYQSTRNRPGSGLGLFLVVNVARRLGGNVRAYNDPSGGAVVILTLPLAALEMEMRDAAQANLGDR